MKKWLVIVEDEQYDWIKKTAAEAGIKGSVLVRSALRKAQEENSTKEIVTSLREAKNKQVLEELENKRAELEEQIRSIKRGSKVTA